MNIVRKPFVLEKFSESVILKEVIKTDSFSHETHFRELTNNNLPELYHFPRIFKTQINADYRRRDQISVNPCLY